MECDKIESDYVLARFKMSKRKRCKKRLFLILLIIFLIVFLIFLYFNKIANPLIIAYGEAQVNKLLVEASNSAISKINTFSYENLIHINYDSDNTISSIIADGQKINSIANILAVDTQNQINDLGIYERLDSDKYPLLDDKGYFRKGGQLEKWGNDDTTHTHPNLAYSIYYNPNTGDVKHLFDYNQMEINCDRSLNIVYQMPNKEFLDQGYVCIRPRITNAGENGRWRLEPETFYKRLINNDFIFTKTKEGYKIYEKDRLKERKFVKTKNFWGGDIAKQESKELLSLFKGKVFDYPKPISLMQYIINIIQNNTATILDFFAGSGTTGHAVMKLNAEDGGNRKFILCTNNENNICRDVTYERIKRVIDKENYSASLKYYKVDFVPISDKLYYEYADELLKHIRELVELENGINFNGNADIAIILTEQELDDFTVNLPAHCKAIYLGHDVLPNEAQERLLKERSIVVNIIPDYYYRELEG